MRHMRTLVWSIASPGADLRPQQYLGELRELPEPQLPGQWCDVVVEERDGPMRWRLVVVEARAQRSIFEERREFARETVRAAGTDGSLDAGGGDGTGSAAGPGVRA